MATQTEAQRLADEIQLYRLPYCGSAAAELRRLEAENMRLVAEVANRNSRALEGDQSKKAFDLAYSKVERLEADNAELKAARFAYASEFALNEEGEPDVGNIHANIRALKAVNAELLEALREIGDGFVAAKDAPKAHDEAVEIARAAIAKHGGSS